MIHIGRVCMGTPFYVVFGLPFLQKKKVCKHLLHFQWFFVYLQKQSTSNNYE